MPAVVDRAAAHAAPVWTTATGLTWEQVVFKLSTGAWPLADAVKQTGLDLESLAVRLGQTVRHGATPLVRSSAQTAERLVRRALGEDPSLVRALFERLLAR